MNITGNLFILSAPSGAGKSSLISALLKTDTGRPTQVSVSHTTRKPRPGEVDGEHYHFVSVEKFKELISQNAFFEWAEVFGNYYGTSKQAIDNQLANGIDVFLDIDWQGAQQVRRLNPDVTTIFICPPSLEELANRLNSRGQDTPEVIQQRMAQARSECSHCPEFEYIIVNDNFDIALQDLVTIVKNQRLSQKQQAEKYKLLLTDLLANQ